MAQGKLWGGKSLHTFDGTAYYNNMKKNLRLRVDNFFYEGEGRWHSPANSFMNVVPRERFIYFLSNTRII